MFRKKTLLLGIFITIISCLFYIIYSNYKLNFFENFELKTYDLRYKLRGQIKKDFDVVIVGIDEKSLNAIGKWPWKRDVHASLIKKLNAYGAKVILFDISFTESAITKELLDYKNNLKQKVYSYYKENKIKKDITKDLLEEIVKLDLEEDYIFAKEIKEAGNIVIGTYNIKDKSDLAAIKNLSQSRYYLSSRYYNIAGILSDYHHLKRTGKRIYQPERVYKIMPPIDIIAKHAFGMAPYEIGEAQMDGVCRGLPVATYEEYSGAYFPPLYLLAYLRSKNLNIRDNVVLDVKKSKVKIYKDKGKKEILKEVRTDKNGYQILNFYGKTYTFDYTPYIDIIENRAEKEKFKDKIVLVGYTDTAKGLYDLRATPFDAITPGVEIHSTAVQNIIDGKFVSRWEVWQNLLLILISSVFITLLLSNKRLSIISENLFTIFFIVAYIVFVYVMLIYYGKWIDTFYPLVVFTFIYLALLFINYFTEGMEKKNIKNAFEHYTSHELLDQVINNPNMLKLGGERKEVTAFFSDIKNFTSLSEKMQAENLVEFLNEYLTAMTKIIIKYNGYIDKYEGDAIMASFGAFGYLENHAELALKAALESQEKLNELRNIWKKEDKPMLSARIGMNTGEVIAGNMGSDERFDYTIIGDEVNLAARLETANKQYGTSIMVSESTYVKTKEKFEFREVDSIRVKGKEKAVTVFEVLADKDQIDDNMKKIVQLSKKGINSYKSRDWDSALGYFESILDIDKNDSIAKLYIDRITKFMIEEPEENWDGVYTMSTK